MAGVKTRDTAMMKEDGDDDSGGGSTTDARMTKLPLPTVVRPMNAFLLFCRNQRPVIQRKNPDLGNRSVSRLLGDTWRKLSQSEKAKYTSQAAEMRRFSLMTHQTVLKTKKRNFYLPGSSSAVNATILRKAGRVKRYPEKMHTNFKAEAGRATTAATTNELAFNFTTDDLVDHGEIGRGSYGTVFKMYHKQSQTVMAVKRILSTDDAKEQKQLLVDLDVIMKSNRCPFIVQLFGAFFEKDVCWICMELMSLSVDKLYKHVYGTMQNRIPEDILGKITVATVGALRYMSDELRIVHRDVRPSNIFADASGNIKLRDNGISARLFRSIAPGNECKPYMAPERIDPRLSSIGYDIRSDVWSLGITLFELATGRFPYPLWTSVFEMLAQVVGDEPPRLPDTDDQYSPMFKDFVNSCLIKDKEKRPKYETLLKHGFVKMYEEKEVDVAGYVSKALAELQVDDDFSMGVPGSSKNEPEFQDIDSCEDEMSELSSSDEETESHPLDQNTAENRENERRDRFAKAEDLDDRLDVPLSRWNLVSRIDTEDQILRIFCPKERKVEIEQALQVELKNIKEELHSFVQVVEMDITAFSIERHSGNIGGGSQIYYVNGAGEKECVTFGHVLVNIKDSRLYILTTCHRDDVLWKNFFSTHNGEEVVLGVCVAVTCSSQPLSESCLVELNEKGRAICCACLGTSSLKPPTVFRGPYIGTTDKLVSPPREVLMCTKTLKRGTIKSVRCRFPDPDDTSRRISGGILTVPVGTEDLAIKGHSGAIIGQASTQSFPVKTWCEFDTRKHAEIPNNQLSGGEGPIIAEGPSRNAMPVDDPSRVIHPMVVENQETQQMDPDSQVEIHSPPMSMNYGTDTMTGIPPQSPHVIVSHSANISQPNPTTQVNIDPDSVSLDPILNLNAAASPLASLASGQNPMTVPSSPAFLNAGQTQITVMTVASPPGSLNAEHAPMTNMSVASTPGSLNAGHAPITNMTVASPPGSLNAGHAPMTNVTVASPPGSLNAGHAPMTNMTVASPPGSLNAGHAPMTNMTVASPPGSLNAGHAPMTNITVASPPGSLNAWHAPITNMTVASPPGSLNAGHAPMTNMTDASPPGSLNAGHAPITNMTVASPPGSLNSEHTPMTNMAVAPHLASLRHGHVPLTNLSVTSPRVSLNMENYSMTDMTMVSHLARPNSRSCLERPPLRQEYDQSLPPPWAYQKRILPEQAKENSTQRTKKMKRNAFSEVFGSSCPVGSGREVTDYLFQGSERSTCSFNREETDMEDQTYPKTAVQSSRDINVNQRQNTTQFSMTGDNAMDLGTDNDATGSDGSTRVSTSVPPRGIREGSMGSGSVNLLDGAMGRGRANLTTDPSNVSENRQRCSCYLEKQAMAHEAISMHCFGMKVLDGGELKGGSVSFRLNLTLKQLEEQIPNAKLELVPILDCVPMQG